MKPRKKSVYHGMSYSVEYAIYRGMIDRCKNPNSPNYKNYGARGIDVCDRWAESFTDFYSDMGPRPEGKQIDRIDNNGDYEPINCKWSTPKENMRNRRNSHFVEHEGKTKILSEWAEMHNIPAPVLFHRLKRSGTLQKALEKPMARTSKYFWFVNGKRYESLRDAANKTGIDGTKLFRLSKGRVDPNIICYKIERQGNIA